MHLPNHDDDYYCFPHPCLRTTTSTVLTRRAEVPSDSSAISWDAVYIGVNWPPSSLHVKQIHTHKLRTGLECISSGAITVHFVQPMAAAGDH